VSVAVPSDCNDDDDDDDDDDNDNDNNNNNNNNSVRKLRSMAKKAALSCTEIAEYYRYFNAVFENCSQPRLAISAACDLQPTGS
jgi:hypothetical protein